MFLQTILHFGQGKPTLPMRLEPNPIRNSLTFFQLSSAFQLLGLGLGLSAFIFVVELGLKHIRAASVMSFEA
jgi:hypothetical protein